MPKNVNRYIELEQYPTLLILLNAQIFLLNYTNILISLTLILGVLQEF